jgi:hypothetical protein
MNAEPMLGRARYSQPSSVPKPTARFHDSSDAGRSKYRQKAARTPVVRSIMSASFRYR